MAEARAKACFLRPESNLRVVWDVLQVVLLLYGEWASPTFGEQKTQTPCIQRLNSHFLDSCTCPHIPLAPLTSPSPQRALRMPELLVLSVCAVLISVPMRLAFGMDAGCGTVGFWIDVLVDLYFVIDIFFNFRTGVYTVHGILETNGKEIACSYLVSAS